MKLSEQTGMRHEAEPVMTEKVQMGKRSQVAQPKAQKKPFKTFSFILFFFFDSAVDSTQCLSMLGKHATFELQLICEDQVLDFFFFNTSVEN
jgi:hypothetical protein